ncbi:helix-turn-helix domain-containing protein [Streptomyces sp. NPDC051976]|uniref:helix-turn-helix domain-containing protein n=1 Tax=Streptomyces sp. NPDC051976 TaxID=3154947 RepID=UPI0034496472
MTTEVEDFATRLRELKERSGRSYGTLATRLHLSTSTLHRYCNGAAVPGDYAPVERFARLCGATPEELLALHRSWLLADASRRREPERAPAPETAPTDPAPPVTEIPATEIPAVDEAAAVEVPSARTTAAATPDVSPGSDSPATRSPRARRTKVVLGAAAVIAVVLPLALYSRFGAHDTSVSGDIPGPTRTTAATPTRTSTATTSGTGTPTATGGPSTPANRTPSAKAPAVPASPAAPTADNGPAPVQVSVLSDNWDTQCDQWFLMDKPPAEVPPPPSLQETNGWAGALGGIPAGKLRLQLTAQGVPGQPVVLHALYVRIVSSRPAAKGFGYTTGSGCGGGLVPASFAVDLDAAVPRAKAVPGYEGENPTPVANFPFQVSSTDSQVLDVAAHTAGRDVRWELDLLWSCGNRQGKLVVNDHGRPFRTAGLKGDPAYFYNGTAWAPATP